MNCFSISILLQEQMKLELLEDGDLSNFSLSQQATNVKGAALENAKDIKVL